MAHRLIDIGVNLAHRSFDSDRSELVARARARGDAPEETARHTTEMARAFFGLPDRF